MKMNDNTLTGVKMGNGFYDTLYAPIELKEFVSNESRLENGKRVIVANPRKASRTFSLEFLVTGATATAFGNNLQVLFTQLYAGSVKLEVPEVSEDVFFLVYQGKSSTYSSGLSKTACRVTVAFEEPDPSRRSESSS